MKIVGLSLTAFILTLTSASPETLVLQSGNTVEGSIIGTNNGEVQLVTDFGSYKFSQDNIKAVRRSGAPPEESTTASRLPRFRKTVLAFSQQPWAPNPVPIPATVIDKGVLRNVPYLSFRSDDYEVNVYGDLKDPAGIEVGVYRKLLTDAQAKQNCFNFIQGLLYEAADKAVVPSLNKGKDLRTREGMTFEVTPPDAEDAYLGWWVSVYSEARLNRARASDTELATISVPKAGTPRLEDPDGWSPEEIKLARSQPETITFLDSSGKTISNATVVRVDDNAYLIWRQGASGGRVKLSDLPAELRTRFGYDQSKAAAAYAAEEAKQKEAASASLAQAAYTQPQTIPTPQGQNSALSSYSSSYSTYDPSSSGRVYVRGYYRKDGTYVSPHTRSYPHRR